MTEPTIVDDNEKSMGIISFLSADDAGFDAVLKARFSDFVVHEVGRDGELALLQSLEVPEDLKPVVALTDAMETGQTESRKRKQPDTDAVGDSTAATAKNEDPWSVAQTKLSESVGPECAEQTVSVLRSWEELPNDNSSDSASDHPKFLVMPELADKQARRRLHESVRSYLAFCALADTHDGRVRIWHKRFEKEMPNYGKFEPGNRQNGKRKPKPQWPSDRPDFLQFILYKENIDTSVATKEVIRRLSHGGNRKVRVGYAGMKDKRGVTSQFCTLYRQDPVELLELNRQGKGGGGTSSGRVSVIRVGNFRYVDKEIQMGMLKGNRFSVALRNVHFDQVNSPPLETEDGRILRTKEILEKAALSFRQRGFINYFGMQRFGKYHDTHKVGVAVLKGDFERAVRIIMEPKPDEQPRSARARDIWARRFQKLDEADQVDDAKARAEATAAREALQNMGRFMTCEMSILNSLARKPLDYKRAFCCIPKSLRLMFLHALQSYLWNRVASQRISAMGDGVVEGDLVLIEDRDQTNGGSGTSGLSGKTVKLVDSDDISAGKFSITDVVLPLVGTKIQYPTNESGSMFESLLKELDLQKQQFGKVQDRELNVGGDYRKVVCLPADVEFKVVEYTDPLQPLLHTDLMLLGKESVEMTIDKTKPTMIAMAIEFTLPPSSYATIALRELMKRPTSSNYQSEQRLERRTAGSSAEDTS